MKKNKLLIFVSLLLFFMSTKVDALCTSKELSKLKVEAFEANIVYDLKFDKNHNSYFNINIYNVSKNVMVIFNSNTYLPDSNGQIKLETALQGGDTYEFKFYGGYDTKCAEEFIYLKRVNIPKYNSYSENEQCIEYEEFPLCNKWYQGDIPNIEFFNSKLEAYIASLKKEEPPKEEIVIEKSIMDKIIDFYVDHIIICLPITIIICLGLIVFVVRKISRRRKRIKLEFD